jgi:PAS domain S-box-containing protein
VNTVSREEDRPRSTASGSDRFDTREDCLVSERRDSSAELNALRAEIERLRAKEEDQRRLEKRFLESQRFYSTLLSHLNGMVYRCRNDPDWTMELVSYGCLELTGHPPSHLIDNRRITFDSLIHADDREALWDKCQASLEAKRRCSNEYRIIRADGEIRWVWDQALGVYTPSGELQAIEGFITDITARKRAQTEAQELEEQLRQAQKLEAIGRLAGGVAHDFNNLLTAVLGNVEMLSGSLGTLPVECRGRFASGLEQIRLAGDRGASLTRQLLAVSRRQVMTPELLDLNDVVTETQEMLSRLIGERIELTLRLDDGIASIFADRGQVQQVILNLVVNARDTMPRGGKLAIETSRAELDEPEAGRREVAAGTKTLLTIRDDGQGIAPQVLPHIFEPFFTTKSTGQGTGLGLATVYGIVRQLEGQITVDTAVGRGTTFRIWFPTTERRASRPSPAPETDARETGGSEVVLVCEDDASVREVLCEVLSVNGYTVIESGNGQAALETAERHPGKIDLLITDVVMPEMDGLELAECLSAKRSDLEIIFVSGYSSDVAEVDELRRKGRLFLPKPFDPTLLLLSVREALDHARAHRRV